MAELETEYPQQLRPFAVPVTTLGMFLNVRVPPFDDLRARRAAAFALNRKELARAMGADRPGSAPIVTCTIIGPGLPGSEPYCPYTEDPNPLGTWSAPNLAEARRLVRASGTQGMAVTVWGIIDTASVSEEAARALSQIGYRTSVRLLGEEYVSAVTDPSTRAQMGIVAIDANTGSPSELIDEAFSCRGPWTDPTLHRVFGFCDASIDDAIDRALALQQTDQYAANRAWAALDHRLVDLAPIVPFAIPAAPLLMAERAGNVQHNPLLGVLLDQIWVR
jgi:peptide/nickel transport system substrate-binding protein